MKTYDLSLKGLFKDPPVNLLKLVLGIEIDPKKVKTSTKRPNGV